MLKSRKFASKEVKTFNAFTSHVIKPTDTYVLGLFNDKNDRLYELYTDLTSRYGEELTFFHSFHTNDFIKHLKSTENNIDIPSIIVYHHDLVVTKKEPQFKVFDNQENLNVNDLENFLFRDSLPLIGHLSLRNKMLIYDKLRPVCYVFHDIDEELRSRKCFLDPYYFTCTGFENLIFFQIWFI
jgi:hypothetical protein